MKILRIIFCFFWILLTLWMLTYSMYLSFVYSVAMLWCFWPSTKKKGKKRWLILGLSPLVIWNVGLVEYGLKTIDLHCRVLGYFHNHGQKKPKFCAYMPEAYSRGVNHKEGALFSKMEQAGVHGFNMMLATGGFFTGLPEVAWETFYMSFAEDPTENGIRNQSRAIRQRQCFGGKKSKKKSRSRGDGNWMLSSSHVRKAVAKNIASAKKVKPGMPKKFRAKKLIFKASGKGGNNGYYGELMRTSNLRVPLTLVVPDGKLYMEGQHTESGVIMDITWKGTIAYPPNALFYFPIPTIYQLEALRSYTGMKTAFPLLLSEGIFCGMLVDGAMNPYTQEWHTRISVDDERVSKTGKQESEKGWIEFLLAPVLN